MFARLSNAIAPLTALISIYKQQNVFQRDDTPIYVLVYAVFAAILGLWVFGHRVIKTIGTKMSQVNPASGFCIEFGAAVTILVASKLGLPISSTHCLVGFFFFMKSQVGSVVSVGHIRTKKGVDWSLVRNVAISWILTLPAAGTITGLSSALFSGLVGAGLMFFLRLFD